MTSPYRLKNTAVIVYLSTDPALGRYWVGEENFRTAERAASINPLGNELLLVAVAGSGANFSIINFRFGKPRPTLSAFPQIHRRQLLAPAHEYQHDTHQRQAVGRHRPSGKHRRNRPFTLAYRPLGSPERSTLEFELSGLPLDLASGQNLLSPADIEAILEAESAGLNHFC